jgi:hypothetical protein
MHYAIAFTITTTHSPLLLLRLSCASMKSFVVVFLCVSTICHHNTEAREERLWRCKFYTSLSLVRSLTPFIND